jgi:hypothetical protein
VVLGYGDDFGNSGTEVDDSSGSMSRNPHAAEQFPVGDTSLSPGLVRSTYPGSGAPKDDLNPVGIAFHHPCDSIKL